MSLKTAFTFGAVAAAAVFATRQFLPSVAKMTVSAPGPVPAEIPLPSIMRAKDGYGGEWVLVPAAAAWYLSR